MTRNSLVAGVGFCTAASLVVALGMAIWVVADKYLYSESVVALFIGALVFWVWAGLLFSLLGAVIIGIPVAIILDGAGLFKPYAMVPVGAVAGYVIGGMSWVAVVSNPYVQVVFAVYGGVGALAFWYGATTTISTQSSTASRL